MGVAIQVETRQAKEIAILSSTPTFHLETNS